MRPLVVTILFLVTLCCLVQAVVDETRLDLNRFGLRKVHDLHPITKVDYRGRRGPSVGERLRLIIDKRPAAATTVTNKPPELAKHTDEPQHEGTCHYCGQAYLDQAQAMANFAKADKSPEAAKHFCRYCGNSLQGH